MYWNELPSLFLWYLIERTISFCCSVRFFLGMSGARVSLTTRASAHV